jgi:hypothetical protein
MVLKIISLKYLLKKLAVFCPNYCYLLQKFDHNIGFREKRQFLKPKIGKNWQKL